MSVFLQLVRKEILDHILSHRFVALAAIGVVAVSLSLLSGYQYYQDRLVDYRIAQKTRDVRLEQIAESDGLVYEPFYEMGHVGFRDHKPPAPTLRRTTGHHAEWLAACRGGPATLCNFTDFAAPLTEVMLLGCLAQRVGKRIEWDPAAMKATNCPEAAAFVTRTYRKGWQI